MIDPIVLKGFRDSLPGEEIPKKNIERKLEEVFESFGFVPIDTPVLHTKLLRPNSIDSQFRAFDGI